MLERICVVLLVGLFCVSSEKVYNGYKIYDINVKSEEDLLLLKSIETFDGEERELDFLSFHNDLKEPVRLTVKPSEQKFIENIFMKNNLNFKIITNNLQE